MQIAQALQTWWQQQTWQELTGFTTGLLCVYLAAKNIIWNWPLAIISVCFYAYIFFEKHLFADAGLQIYLLIMNVYGWYHWSKKSPTDNLAPVVKINGRQTWVAIFSIAAVTVFLGSVLRYTSASYPYLDSFCAACSVVAQVLLARKVLENWLIWTFVNIIYVGIYIFKDLHITALMYAIYIPIVISGYLDWKKEVK
ncbi:nicotinamide riboside transporter PnuC [Mucilaginibacter auburnensis]|uniref:Nicotinamide riboside transporter PnuC n=1 Tax=Mucilaginibacter auburnensis TaxID=1457233 RepID=A0A2H9VTE2_9SPHI|nr:nicotinamide riboside transporter PnuC [Mucilaginibacter auburnensis]PJJ84095.1 nicotinamide mononucleotide transporter [Mucilaginibacter auburnensis]